MVERRSITQFARNGLADWLWQRVSALLLAAYTIFLAIYVGLHWPLAYSAWHGLFASTWFKVCTLFAVLSLLVHSWVGLWTVMTDYVKSNALRLLLHVLLLGVLLIYLIWVCTILYAVN